MFGTREDEVDALEAIDNQLFMLHSANDAPNGHVLLMEEQDDEVLEKMSEYQKWVVRQKILFLTCVLSCKRPDAITNMGRLLQQSDGDGNQLWI